MGQTALIPAWVVPTAQEVADCHWIAHATGRTHVVSVLDWVTSEEPDEQDAFHRMTLVSRAAGLEAAHETLAWLLGMSGIPPIQLPRRNEDGSVITAAQLYREYMAGKTGLPEQKREAQTRAVRDAARYQRLADLVPH